LGAFISGDESIDRPEFKFFLVFKRTIIPTNICGRGFGRPKKIVKYFQGFNS